MHASSWNLLKSCLISWRASKALVLDSVRKNWTLEVLYIFRKYWKITFCKIKNNTFAQFLPQAILLFSFHSHHHHHPEKKIFSWSKTKRMFKKGEYFFSYIFEKMLSILCTFYWLKGLNGFYQLNMADSIIFCLHSFVRGHDWNGDWRSAFDEVEVLTNDYPRIVSHAVIHF